MTFLPYGKHCVDEEDIEAVKEVLQSDWLTTGPKVEEFEQRLAKEVDAKYSVAFNSGTSALHAAYFAAGLKENDEIITSPITFVATANAALYLGATPKFVDIDYSTGNININKIEENITEKTKIIAPVDFAGHPTDLDEIKEIAKQNNLIVVEDAAHALGGQYKDKKVGSIADMTIFSFHPLKHITTGEGGAVTTNNYEFYKKLKMFRTHGITKDKDELYHSDGDWYHEMHLLGYNYRINDIQCALGISQLDKLGYFVDRRKKIASEYNRRLKNLEEYIELPQEKDYVSSSWHLYPIKVKESKEKRKQLFDYLRERKLGVQVHYIPVYYQPYYQNLGYKKGLCSQAEKFYESVISIPIFPKMTDDDVDRVCKDIEEFFRSEYCE